jgi:metal-sulfur cluster biosynthetic enzyme
MSRMSRMSRVVGAPALVCDRAPTYSDFDQPRLSRKAVGTMTEVDPVITQVLRGVYDPCCRDKGISVVDMGLLYRARVSDGVAHVELLLTSGWCPFASRVLADIEAAVTGLPQIDEADVRIVWDEPWDASRLSEEARGKLRFMPAPAQVADREAFIASKLKPARQEHASQEGSR